MDRLTQVEFMNERPGVKDAVLMHFRMADKDGDGKLTGAELSRYIFDLYDVDKDGELTMKELSAAYDNFIAYTMLPKSVNWES